MEQMTVVKTVLSATGVGQKNVMLIYIYIYIYLKILILTKGFSSLFRRTAVLFIMPHYLKLFQYSLNVSDKIC